MHNPGRVFRDLLRTEPYLFTGGVYSPLDAQIAERVGMKSIYLSGYSMALANGWPDMGFLTQTEVTRIGAMVASAVEIPVIADADDGYGNALSTIRTVQEYVRSGVAGIHIEDQVSRSAAATSPARRSSASRMAVGKYRAGVDTRDRMNPDFVIIARTDAFGAVGGSLRKRSAAAAPTPTPASTWCGRELSSPPRAGRGLRQGDARVPPESPAGLQLLLARSSGTRTRTRSRSGSWASSATSSSSSRSSPPTPAMYAVWNAMEELVRDQEQAQWTPGEDQGRPSDREPPRDGPREPLPGAGEAATSPAATSAIKGSAGYDDQRMH